MPNDIRERINSDLRQAILSKNRELTSTLRLIYNSILNKEKEKRIKLAKSNPDWTPQKLEEESKLTDQEVLEVLSSEAKKRKESIQAFSEGQREDLAEKERAELEIIQKYLPKQLSEKEIEQLVKEVAEAVGASSPKDMGKVMSLLMPKIKGRAEGSLVSKIVTQYLTAKVSEQ